MEALYIAGAGLLMITNALRFYWLLRLRQR